METYTEKPLAILSRAEFNADGIGVVVATGTRYGGEWIINIIRDDEVIGSLRTGRTDDPELATNAAFGWLAEQCATQGLKIAGLVSHNDKYPPDQRPFFMTVQACIVDQCWV